MTASRARIYANATNTKYKNGEGTPEDIIAAYNLSIEDTAQVLEAFYVVRPDLRP